MNDISIFAIVILLVFLAVMGMMKSQDKHHDYCYTDMEYEGHAAFGCCHGNSEECVDCKHYVQPVIEKEEVEDDKRI